MKRAEKPFKDKIGVEKTSLLFENIKRATNEIPAKFRRTIGSEIPKYLFNLSRELEDVPPEIIEKLLHYVLIFTNSLKDLLTKDRNQVNQLLINRSGNQMRNLSDLMLAFVEKAINNEKIFEQVSFEEILSFLFGSKTEVTRLDDIELFIRRAEKNFALKLGEEASSQFSSQMIEVLSKVDKNLRDYFNSEISKYLFKFSQSIEILSPNVLKEMLNHMVIFINSITNVDGKTADQINQEIIRRSKNQLYNLLDLFKAFVQAAKENNLLESSISLEDILFHLLGEEEERVQFSDVEAFLKRAEKKYALIIGQDMIDLLTEELLESINLIPEQHREYLGSDLAKFIFKFSESASYHEPEKVESLFNGAIMFANSLVELDDLNNAEINQFIINRSSHEVRSLFDLFKAFLEKIEVRMPLSSDPTFDEILVHTLGRYDGPKIIDKGGLIHDLLADYHEEIPFSKEHFSWAKAIAEIIPRFLEILPNPEGDRILDFLWENKLSMDQIHEQYREKLAETPREKEKTFMFRLLNLLTNQILIDEEKDKALTGALAFRILGTIFIEMFGGRNAQIRAIRLNQLLKDRKIANLEKKQSIDEHINRILEEDLKAIQQRVMTINTIVPILSKKGYFIKTYDIVTKDFPELIVKIISYREEERLKDIGKEYKKSGLSGEIIPLVNSFLTKLDLANRFYKKYFEEMYSIEMDAQNNMLRLRKFFKSLVELGQNIDTIEFFENRIANTEHSIYKSLLTYLYAPLSEVFEITSLILNEQEYQNKIMKLDKYLSKQKLEQVQIEIRETEKKIKEYENLEDFDASQKIVNLTKFLSRDKNELKFYETMFKLLNESEEIGEILENRLKFAKKLLRFSNSLKKIHSSLPAALAENLENLTEFNQEINKIINQLQEKSSSGILSPFEFREKNDAAELIKKELLTLCSDENFVDHINMLKSMSEVKLFEEY
ncbi:MAG: hypothetical protein ACFFE4_03275 [Candidatus Thorarchaeota archaeon]